MLYYAKRMDTYMGTSFWKNKGVVIAKYCVWPHLWPSTGLDYLETVLTRAPESTVFGLKSTKNAPKSLKKSPPTYSGHWSWTFNTMFHRKTLKALKQKGFRAFLFSPKLLELAWFFLFNHMFWPLIKTHIFLLRPTLSLH